MEQNIIVNVTSARNEVFLPTDPVITAGDRSPAAPASRWGDLRRRLVRVLYLGLRPEVAVSDGAGLAELARSKAAVIAQKTMHDYCRNKTGSFSHALYEEEAFRAAMTVCQWEGFAAVLADILIVMEGFLRPHAGDRRERLAAALVALHAAILRAERVPGHRRQGWDDAIAAFAPRLAAAQLRAAEPPMRISRASGRRIFESLPIHERYRALDEEMIQGAVAFQMTAVLDAMRRLVDPQAVVADLLRQSETQALRR